MNRHELLKAAVDTWGIDAQVMMAIEEMAELTQALAKIHRPTVSGIENLLEEIADVRITLDQLALIFHREDLENFERTKLHRLAFLLGTTYEPTLDRGRS